MVEHRISNAWYIKYASDPYALGPLRFDGLVNEEVVFNTAFDQFDEYPDEIWPDGHVEYVNEGDE